MWRILRYLCPGTTCRTKVGPFATMTMCGKYQSKSLNRSVDIEQYFEYLCDLFFNMYEEKLI